MPRLVPVVASAALCVLAMGLGSGSGCAAGNQPPPTGSVTGSGGATSASAVTAVTTATSSSGSTTAASTTSESASSTTTATSTATSTATTAATTGATTTSSVSSTSSGCATYGHTITIDGTNDFAADETFATTSTGYTSYIAWDTTYLYVGMSGIDISSLNPNKWVVVYLSGTGGTTTGVQYNTQKPTLPFSAKWHVRWKSDNLFTNALTWNGTAWVDAAWDFTGDVFQMGTYLEMRILRTNIGSPGQLSVHVDMLNETANMESTYAGNPSTSFVDGYNPTNFMHYYDFDLNGCKAPTMFSPM